MKKAGNVGIVLLVVVAVFWCSVAGAATWPAGRVTVIWHSAAGSGGDLLFRALSKFLENKTKVTFIVENVTGASGANAWTRVARSKPDGSVILGVSSTFIASPVQNKIPVNYTNFDPVARLFIDAVCLYVGGNSPYQTFEDFAADARKRPGELTLTGGTTGNVEFVAARELMREAGIDVPIVPFEGGSEGVVAVMGGHVSAGIGEYAEMASAVEGGKIRVLATFNKLSGLDIPTVAELGYKTKVEKFRGVIAPKGMSQEIKDAIVTLLKEAMEDPDFKTYYTKNHLVPAFAVGDEFYSVMEKQTEDVKVSLGVN
ncbi:MAG: tripartite tricarboxylate transporter substrate binding protein [Synergistaceae bacterium]|jgi:putative tricarboxylic transport membrane protein|nr:tripartite tricarboxylate transporter substrate binding protein [Synergistaceae bacterium]